MRGKDDGGGGEIGREEEGGRGILRGGRSKRKLRSDFHIRKCVLM